MCNCRHREGGGRGKWCRRTGPHFHLHPPEKTAGYLQLTSWCSAVSCPWVASLTWAAVLYWVSADLTLSSDWCIVGFACPETLEIVKGSGRVSSHMPGGHEHSQQPTLSSPTVPQV